MNNCPVILGILVNHYKDPVIKQAFFFRGSDRPSTSKPLFSRAPAAQLLQVVNMVDVHQTWGIWELEFYSDTSFSDDQIWANYSDLTRPHPKWWFSKGNPLISGKSRLVKYYNLARSDGGKKNLQIL